MRVTNNQLTKKQADWVEITTKEKHEAINPETKKPVSVDFSKDLYSLLDTLIPHTTLKNFMQIDTEVADGYVKRKLTDYLKVRQHYSAIKRFLREFSHTRLYQHLQSLNNPEKALEILLDMFCPPPPPNQSTQKSSQNGQDDKDNQNQSQGQGQENKDKNNQQNQQSGNSQGQQNQQEQQKQQNQQQKQDNQNQQNQQQKGNNNQSKQNQQENQQDQREQENNQKSQEKDKQEEMDNSQENEISNNPPPPVLDIEKFKQDMPSIEEALKNNIFDDDMMRELMEKQAGTEHGALTTIEGLAKNINAISRFVKNENFKILDAARKFSATEQYTREENLSDVTYPEKDWRVTNIKTISDLPKVLPYQFLYPDAIFDKMMIDKDLKIKQHQSRKKKKQVLYILIDGSGSMNILRQMTASAIAIAYIKKAIEEQSLYFFRHFDAQVFDLHTVTNKDEAVKEISYLMNNPRSSGGTNIDVALRKAINDINDPKLFKQDKKDKSELYERADILIITDGEDEVSVSKEYLEEKKIVLHSFLLDNQHENLKKISHSYQYLSASQMRKIIHN